MENVTITPRKFNTELDDEIPRHWCNNSPFMTHMLNIYTLLVPENELYYIRQLKRWEDQLTDKKLINDLQLFCRQEVQHGMGHKKYWDNFDSLGLKVKGFADMVGWFNYKFLEPILPKKVHVANIACIEHINAYLGNFYLQRGLLDESDERMRTLFYWHFAEEIEHKSVAFDVFQEISGSYLLRITGALLVFPLFYLINTCGTFYLLAQEGKIFCRKTWKDIGKFLFSDGAFGHALYNMMIYCKPGFKPEQVNDYHLAKEFFADENNQKHFKEFPQS